MEGKSLELTIAFTSGLLSFLSPCVLPLIPSYVTFITGLSLDDVQKARRAALIHSLLFIAGFTMIFLAFGASFELPVALVILVLLGWVTPQQLKDSRGYAVVGVFVVAAVITPPDVVSQLMLAIPMCILYELGIVASRWLKPREDAGTTPGQTPTA